MVLSPSQELLRKALEEEGLSFSFSNYSIQLDPSLLKELVDIPSIKKTKMDPLLNNLNKPFYSFSSSLLINYLSLLIKELEKEGITPKRDKERAFFAFVKLKNPDLKKFGKYILGGSSPLNLLLLSPNEKITEKTTPYKNSIFFFLQRNLRISTPRSFEILINREEEKKFFCLNNPKIISLPFISSIRVGEDHFVWVLISKRSFKEDSLALADCVLFDNEVREKRLAILGRPILSIGGVLANKKVLINPNLVVDFDYLEKLLDEVRKSEEKYAKLLNYVWRLKTLKNSLIYLSNFRGDSKNFYERLKEKKNLLREEVILDKNLFEEIKDKLVKGLDYYVVENRIVTKLLTVIEVFLNLKIKSISFILSPSSFKGNSKTLLKISKYKGIKEELGVGSSILSFFFEEKRVLVKVKEGCGNHPLQTFSYEYLIIKGKDEKRMVMV